MTRLLPVLLLLACRSAPDAAGAHEVDPDGDTGWARVEIHPLDRLERAERALIRSNRQAFLRQVDRAIEQLDERLEARRVELGPARAAQLDEALREAWEETGDLQRRADWRGRGDALVFELVRVERALPPL